MTLDAPHLTWLFLATVAGLGAAFVWLFCELETRIGGRFGPAALSRFGYRTDGKPGRKMPRGDD